MPRKKREARAAKNCTFDNRKDIPFGNEKGGIRMKENRNPYATNGSTVRVNTADTKEPCSTKISGNDLRIKKGS